MGDTPPKHGEKFSLKSHAKLNLFLEVIGKRDDGFHELETVMLRTDFCDTIHFSPAESRGVQLELAKESNVSSHQFPCGDSNLIVRAANAVMEYSQERRGASICVVKNIPAEAGLAGGSGNAATTLIGLNRLWNLQLSKTQLHNIAAGLGSDINFFVEDCRAAICRGRGELVESISVSGKLYFVAVHPGIGNSTPDVFSRLTPSDSHQSCGSVVDALAQGDAAALSSFIFNRLTHPASESNASMASLLTSMQLLTGKPAFMSGSGSTCFVVADSHDEAVEFEDLLKSQNFGRVFRLSS